MYTGKVSTYCCSPFTAGEVTKWRPRIFQTPLVEASILLRVAGFVELIICKEIVKVCPRIQVVRSRTYWPHIENLWTEWTWWKEWTWWTWHIGFDTILQHSVDEPQPKTKTHHGGTAQPSRNQKAKPTTEARRHGEKPEKTSCTAEARRRGEEFDFDDNLRYEGKQENRLSTRRIWLIVVQRGCSFFTSCFEV